MSTIQRQSNFTPARDVLGVTTRSVIMADATLLDPLNAVALVDGEWMVEDTNGKAVRAADVTSLNNRASVKSFPHWLERGRTDMRAMGEPKSTWLWMGKWEFDTRVFDAAVALGSGAAITFWMQGVKVATIAGSGSRNYVGLVGHGGSGDSDPIVGYVTKLPTNNGGKLRVRGGEIY